MKRIVNFAICFAFIASILTTGVVLSTNAAEIEPLFLYEFKDGLGKWNTYNSRLDSSKWGVSSYSDETKTGLFPINVWSTRPGGFWGIQSAPLEIMLKNENQKVYMLIRAKADDLAKRFFFDGQTYLTYTVDNIAKDAYIKGNTSALHNNTDYVDLIVELTLKNNAGAKLTFLNIFFPSATSDGSGVIGVTGGENGYISIKYIGFFENEQEAIGFTAQHEAAPEPTTEPSTAPTTEPSTAPTTEPSTAPTTEPNANTGDMVTLQLVQIFVCIIVSALSFLLLKKAHESSEKNIKE